MKKYDDIRERVSSIQDEVEGMIKRLIESHGPIEIPEGGLIMDSMVYTDLFVVKVDVVDGEIATYNKAGENLVGPWSGGLDAYTAIDLAEAIEKALGA